MMKKLKEKKARKRVGSAEVSRLEYKYSRDYKVTLFCFLLPISCDRRQKEAYNWVMHCKQCVCAFLCVCVHVCVPTTINKIFKGLQAGLTLSSVPCPRLHTTDLIGSQSVYPTKQKDNKLTLMPSFSLCSTQTWAHTHTHTHTDIGLLQLSG